MFSSGEFYPGDMPIRFVLEFRSLLESFCSCEALVPAVGHGQTVSRKWKEGKNILIFFLVELCKMIV